MLIRPGRSSGNLIDRRGGRGGGMGKGLGIVGVLVVLIGSCVFGVDLRPLLDSTAGTSVAVDDQASAPSDEASAFVDAILVETEDVWGALYRESGETYPEPDLVLYTGATRTACGTGQAAMGPFYCPADQSVYLDLSFFNQLERMGARGEFAVAYVIAHEVAHHIQNVEGLLGGRQSAAMSVQTELQADCLAGVWAHYAEDERGRLVLNESDIESGISAAAAVGDDAIQERSGQAVRPETFTHGSSQQRVDAFLGGYRSGDYAVCFS